MRRCLRDMAVIAGIVVCCAMVGTARADGRAMAPAAKAELDRGLERFKAKDYAAAIAAFDAGYAIDAKPEFLYVKAQAQRLSGDCRKAIETYRAYLATHPPDDKVEYANANIDRCEKQLAAEPEPATNEPGEPRAAESRPAPTSAAPATTSGRGSAGTAPGMVRPQGEDVEAEGGESRWRDRKGLWLAGSGAVALGLGVTFAVLARTAASDAGAAEDIDRWEAAHDAWARDRRIAQVATVAGVGLGIIAAIRFATVKEPKRRVALGVGATANAGVLVIGGRW